MLMVVFLVIELSIYWMRRLFVVIVRLEDHSHGWISSCDQESIAVRSPAGTQQSLQADLFL
jgi:hypothetical protein